MKAWRTPPPSHAPQTPGSHVGVPQTPGAGDAQWRDIDKLKGKKKKPKSFIVSIILGVLLFFSVASCALTDDNSSSDGESSYDVGYKDGYNAAINGEGESTETTTNSSTSEEKDEDKETTQAKEEEKKSYSTVEYKKLARNPEDYIGKALKITGKVLQADDGCLRVATDKDEYDDTGYGYDDVVFVVYSEDSLDYRILEDDVVTVCGIGSGTYEYESVLGENIELPWIKADKVDVK